MELPFSTLPAPRPHQVDAEFLPTRCPRAHCSAHSGEGFTYQLAGSYVRAGDLRVVRRFRCLVCRSRFSSQCFRVDYRLRKPWLPLAVFQGLVAKTTLRQISRSLGCKLDTVLHHLQLVGTRGHELHAAYLARCKDSRGGLSGAFQLDELETFELNRRLCPLTVPVLVHAETWFVVHAATGTLPARGNLGQFDLIRKERYEKERGKRVSQSKEATRACVVALQNALGSDAYFVLQTDQKSAYRGIFRDVFGRNVRHQVVNSKERRDRKNLLFTINNTLAQARDGMSRLVRRNWGHSKLERNLRWHLGAWILWRNYAREITCKCRQLSSASALGVTARRLKPRELFQWRDRLPAGS
jgi:transposase-like protein